MENNEEASIFGALPEKRGWLQKQSTTLIKRWQDRYFVLKNRILEYYHSETDSSPAMTINFDQVSADLNIINDKEPPLLILMISGCKRSFKLRASDPEVLFSWGEALVYHISDSKGTKMSLISVGSKNVFWKYARISNNDFISQVRSGDILLFKSKAFASKLQRGVTLSSFDHVALLLKFQDNSVGVLESTSQFGVKTVFWSDFIEYNWHLDYKLLVYRKLEYDRPQDFTSKLQEFILKVEGKKYSLNPKKIFKNFTPGNENNFFCSELVASAYKYLGLLPRTIKSSTYLPVHFSSKKELEMTTAKLGQEYVIDFQII
jgi:hypothetical protein